METQMHPLDIQVAIKKTGLNQRKLAMKLGVSECLVSKVIFGTAKSQRVQEYIAIRINKPVSDLWPEKTITDDDSAAA
jgi:lambda repressor-like predicted transcriptional regulator